MANVAYALEREELSAEFRRELEALLRQKEPATARVFRE
jgi:UTP--glucose-1-phosphate uridylyltransferase